MTASRYILPFLALALLGGVPAFAQENEGHPPPGKDESPAEPEEDKANLDELLRDLYSFDSLRRTQAIEQLAVLDDPAVTEALVRIATSATPHPFARSSAIAALGKRGDPKAVPHLNTILKNPAERTDLRTYAADALGNIGGDEAEKALEETAVWKESGSFLPRLFALNALYKYSRDKGNALALKIFRDAGENVSLRSGAARILGQSAEEENVGALSDVVRDEKAHPVLRSACAGALSATEAGRKSLQPVMADKAVPPDLRVEIARLLLPHSTEAAVAGLLDVAANEKAQDGVRQTALRLLVGKVSDENAGVLIKIAEGEQKTSPLRDQAVRLLSGLKAAGVAEFFAKILADVAESGPVREIAAKTLGGFEDKAGESALLETLQSQAQATVRAACAQALARRGSAAAVDILGKEVETAERDYLRPAFLKALAELSPERARPALEKIIADKKEEPLHRINALILLQGVTEGKVPAAAGGLLAARDDDIVVRAQVIDFIVSVGDRSYADRIYELIDDEKENPQLRARCVEAAALMSLEGAEEKLLGLLGDADAILPLRGAAIGGLGLMKAKGAVPKLLEVFANDRESDTLRTRASEALAEIGDKSALNKVRELAENSPSVAVRNSAVRLLGALPDAASFEILNKISADQAADIEVRREAVRALGLLKDKRAYDTLVAILGEGVRSLMIQPVAISALGDLGDERALEPLGRIVLLPTMQSFLQFPAVNAIAKIGGDKAIEILETVASDEFRPGLALYARSHLEELRKQKENDGRPPTDD